MTHFYELVVLGAPSEEQVSELKQLISKALKPFGLRLGQEVAWKYRPNIIQPKQQYATAVVFFGGKDVSQANLKNLLEKNIPILPVVSAPL